jgi:molybdopterin-guanine dinucleotide biosynthesis protein MobB
MPPDPRTPVLGLAAYSGTGKTTLLRALIPLLRQRGLRLGLLKHSHHAFEIDKPGKDSYRLRQAGATQMLVASAYRSALMMAHEPGETPDLQDLLRRLDDHDLDLILVEGFKHSPIPKVELHRPSLGHPLLCPDDAFILAVAADGPLAGDVAVPILDLNAPRAIAEFICARCLDDRQA